jgi:hypothetical protein
MENKEIKVVATDSNPQTSHSSGCNRMQPPKIKIKKKKIKNNLRGFSIGITNGSGLRSIPLRQLHVA